VDDGDELQELDARARRGEIPLAEYFARRAALLPGPVQDPATAPYSVRRAPAHPDQTTGGYPATPERAHVHEPSHAVSEPALNADTVPPPAVDDPSRTIDIDEDDNLTLTRPPWHVQNMLAQRKPPPRDVPAGQDEWRRGDPHAVDEATIQRPPHWQPPPPARADGPAEFMPMAPHVMDSAPITPDRPRYIANRESDRRRRAFVSAIVIVLLAAGVGAWMLTQRGEHNTADKNPQPPGTQASTPMASQSAGTRPGFDDQHPIAAVPGARIDASGTGPATLAQAQARNLMYPGEATRLAGCGASSGTTQVLDAADWRSGATAFTCRNDSAAAGAVEELAAAEHAPSTFAPIIVRVPRVTAFINHNKDATSRPTTVIVRYASGKTVVRLLIWTETDAAGNAALEQILPVVIGHYPPS
jgi:hypothetical protein